MIITPTVISTLSTNTLYTVKWATLQKYPDFINITALNVPVYDKLGALYANINFYTDATQTTLLKTALVDQNFTVYLISLTS